MYIDNFIDISDIHKIVEIKSSIIYQFKQLENIWIYKNMLETRNLQFLKTDAEQCRLYWVVTLRGTRNGPCPQIRSK